MTVRIRTKDLSKVVKGFILSVVFAAMIAVGMSVYIPQLIQAYSR